MGKQVSEALQPAILTLHCMRERHKKASDVKGCFHKMGGMLRDSVTSSYRHNLEMEEFGHKDTSQRVSHFCVFTLSVILVHWCRF